MTSSSKRPVRPRMLYWGQDQGTPRAQEERVAAAVGGKRHRGSGSSMYLKGDASNARWLIEAKQTQAASIRITKAWLDKLSQEAQAVQKLPALAIEIQGGPSDVLSDRDWVCMPMWVFRQLTEGAAS